MSRTLSKRATLLGGAYAPAQAPVTPAAGRKAVFLGDSITHRSNAAAGRGFVDQIPKILGSALISATRSVEAGVPGQTTDQMRARYATDVRGNKAEVLFLLCGTNDVGAGRTLAQWSADVRAIVAMAKQDGIPVIIGTVPPRGTSSITTAIRTLTAQYNAWLKMWAPTVGVKVAPVHLNLCQGTSDQMQTGFDSGDGVHPETAGHQKIAEAFADAYSAAGLNTANHVVTRPDVFNMITNPLFTTNMAGWFEQPGGTGTAPTYAVVADTTSTLQAGQWQQMDFDCTAAGGNRYRCTSLSSGFAVGDTIFVTARLQATDLVGGFYAAANTATPTVAFSLRIFDQSFTSVALFGANSVRFPGPIAQTFTVPAGMTSFTVAMQAQLPTGQHCQFRIGEVGVYNVTALPDLAALL